MTQNYMFNARMPNTLKSYDTQEKKWLSYCLQKNIDCENPSKKDILEFLSNIASKGLTYTSVNSARSSLSSFLPQINGIQVGKDYDVRELLSGIRNTDPPMPRWNATWRVDTVLDYLRELSPLSHLTLRQLSYKLVMLLLITSCQRIQSVEFLKISHMIVGTEEIVFRLDRRLKHNKRGSLQILQFKEFKLDLRLCVVFTIKHYIGRTKDIRKGEDQLLISYKPPYQKVSSNTLSRWTREIMEWAGLDSSVFTTHSVRSAVASQMSRINIPIKDIMKKASWQSECTFRQFYQKPLMDKDPSTELLTSYRNTKGFCPRD